jgi:hypothetical protein
VVIIDIKEAEKYYKRLIKKYNKEGYSEELWFLLGVQRNLLKMYKGMINGKI